MTMKESLGTLKSLEAKTVHLFFGPHPNGISASVLVGDDGMGIRIAVKNGGVIERQFQKCRVLGAERSVICIRSAGEADLFLATVS